MAPDERDIAMLWRWLEEFKAYVESMRRENRETQGKISDSLTELDRKVTQINGRCPTHEERIKDNTARLRDLLRWRLAVYAAVIASLLSAFSAVILTWAQSSG